MELHKIKTVLLQPAAPAITQYPAEDPRKEKRTRVTGIDRIPKDSIVPLFDPQYQFLQTIFFMDYVLRILFHPPHAV